MEILTQFDARTIHLFTSGALAFLCLLALLAALVGQVKLRRARREGMRLRRELESCTQSLEKCREVTKKLQAAEPRALVTQIADARHRHDVKKADAVLAAWCESQGADVARLLIALAAWAYVRARGDKRPAALIAAERFAAAALTLAPELAEISGFYGEICEIRKNEPRRGRDAVAAQQEVLQMLRPGAEADLFDVDPVLVAEDAEREGEAQYAAGRNYLALAAVSRALQVRMAQKNGDPDQILNDQALEGYVLLGLGRESEALARLHGVADAMSADPLYGPDHPDTLACRYELARILGDLGRRDEAMTMICNVLERQMSSADLGPEHPDTMESQKFLERLRAEMPGA